MTDPDLRREIRFIIAKYGYESVFTELHSVMETDLSSLQKLLQKIPKREVAAPAAVVEAAPSITTEVQIHSAEKLPTSTSSSKSTKHTTIKVKKEGQEKRGRKKKSAAAAAPQVSPLDQEEVVHPVVEQKAEEPDGKFRDAKEMRVWQRAQEQKKRAELDAKGVSIASLLTKENLEKWVSQDGRTYSYIAREYVGCPDSQVSAAAKTFGIQSSNSVKRFAMIQQGKN